MTEQKKKLLKAKIAVALQSELVLQSPFGLECQQLRLRHAQIDRPGSAVRATAERGGPADSGKGDCSIRQSAQR